MTRKMTGPEELNERAYMDPLTSVYNRKFFTEYLRQSLLEGEESIEITFALVNVDDFAHYNEMNGFERGDQILQQVAYLLKRHLRVDDYVIRYEEDEFLAVLTRTSKSESFFAAERLRKLIEAHPFPGEMIQPTGCITVSIGVASFPEDGESLDFLVKRAGTALSWAKQRMKNRVEVFNF